MPTLVLLVIGFVVVLVIVLFIGSLDDARPVSTWSDDKLKRMGSS